MADIDDIEILYLYYIMLWNGGSAWDTKIVPVYMCAVLIEI